MPQAVYTSEGNQIDYTPAGALAAGDVVVTGELVGFTPKALAANELGVLIVSGVAEFTKQAALAITLGALVYWDDTANVANVTGTNKLIGKCIKAAAAGDATVFVMMDQ